MILSISFLQYPVIASSNSSTDKIGKERGISYDENLQLGSDISPKELDSVVMRSISRVEKIRKKEFTGNISVQIKSKKEFKKNSRDYNISKSHSDWNNQVWEALFIVGENRNVTKELSAVFQRKVRGFYSDKKINIILKDTENLNELVLAHEIVHALQDSSYNLSKDFDTQDKQLTWLSVVEGEANYVRKIYKQKCEKNWECIGINSRPASSNSENINQGIFILLYFPYSDGPPYIHNIKKRKGWEKVSELFQKPPKNTTQIIHNKIIYNESRNSNNKEILLTNLLDKLKKKCQIFKDQGNKGYDIAGEASIFSMFWYQSKKLQKRIIDVENFWRRDSNRFDSYNYTSTPSEGWKRDRIYPYKCGSRSGYVWYTVWSSERDADEFVNSYLKILRGNGAIELGENLWKIPSGSFEDTFRIKKDQNKVLIVNSPNRENLEEIYDNGSLIKGRKSTTYQSGFGILSAVLSFLVFIYLNLKIK